MADSALPEHTVLPPQLARAPSNHKLVNALHLGVLFNRMHWSLTLSDYLLTDAIRWDDEVDSLLKYLARFEAISSQSELMRAVEEQTETIIVPPEDDRLPDDIEQCEREFLRAYVSSDPSLRFVIVKQINDALAYRFNAALEIREVLIGPLCCPEKKVLRLHQLVFELGELLDQGVRPQFADRQVVRVMTFFYPLRHDLRVYRPERPDGLDDDNCSSEEKVILQRKYDEDVHSWKSQLQLNRDQVREKLIAFLDRFIADEFQESSLAREKMQSRLDLLKIDWTLPVLGGGQLERSDKLAECLSQLETHLAQAFPQMHFKGNPEPSVLKTQKWRTERDKAAHEYYVKRDKERGKGITVEEIWKEFNSAYKDRGWHFNSKQNFSRAVNSFAKKQGLPKMQRNDFNPSQMQLAEEHQLKSRHRSLD